MNAKGWMLSAGLGAAAGAVAVLMMPRQNPVRRVAAKAANKAEDLAWKVEDQNERGSLTKCPREANASRGWRQTVLSRLLTLYSSIAAKSRGSQQYRQSDHVIQLRTISGIANQRPP